MRQVVVWHPTCLASLQTAVVTRPGWRQRAAVRFAAARLTHRASAWMNTHQPAPRPRSDRWD